MSRCTKLADSNYADAHNDDDSEELTIEEDDHEKPNFSILKRLSFNVYEKPHTTGSPLPVETLSLSSDSETEDIKPNDSTSRPTPPSRRNSTFKKPSASLFAFCVKSALPAEFGETLYHYNTNTTNTHLKY
jgi:hypothetical protein